MLTLRPATTADFPALVALWERSVRATHDFLPPAVIEELRPLILEQYLPALAVQVAEQQGVPLGFVSVGGDRVEMLFIEPAARGQGIGRLLLEHALHHQQARAVDVNEQNCQALAFYQHLGFEVIGRSALDGEGRPFPLLHLRWPG